ncbi:MAG: hypothetical protein WC813_03010 [Patescibacteria group bacterium]|jgi:hypothetical protein
MQHVLETGKRALSAAVAAATIAFSIGAGALMSPAVTHAAAAGDRIRSASLSTVYYYGYDGMRYTYPNLKTYSSWHSNSSGVADFSGVMTVSDSTISDITLGGNIVFRPGSSWIKVTSDPKTYAVGRNGKIYWIETEAVAVAYAGSDWNQRIMDVPDVFFTDYTVGASLMSATAYNGMMYSSAGNTYLNWDGAKRLVSSAGMSANGLQSMYVMDGAGVVDSALSAGADLTTKEASVSDDAQTVTGTVVSTGGLTVSAASSMPAGASLPGGSNSVQVFSFNVQAGSAAATFSGVTLSMIGAGSTNNISSVYLYEGSTRLTESRTVNSSTRQVSFNNLNRSIAANSMHTYTVRVTTSTSQVAADTFGFKVANSADVVSAGSVSGSFPITGNIFTFTGADAGTLLITKSGTIADPTVGAQDAEIGSFKAAANGSEAADISAITVKVDNASDHSDFRLWDGSVLLTTGVNSSGDWVVFDLSAHPFHINEGGNNIFSVSADIGGQSADTVKVFIDNNVDIVAIGGDFGFGLTVDTGTVGTYDGASCTSSSGNCSFSTVKGGKLTFAFNGPAAGDVQVDSQDQTLLKFSVTATQFITIKDLDIQVAADDDDDGTVTEGQETGDADDDGLINSGSEANLKDIKIINADTGAVIMGPLELDTTTDDASSETSLTGTAEDALQIIDFTDDFSLNAGETLNLAVTADVDNGLTSGESLAAIFDMSGLVTEDTNGDALATADIIPGSDITGYTQVARQASLVVSLASTPTSVTTVDGTQNVSVVGFTMTTGLASPVTITDLTLSAYGQDTSVSGTYDIGGGVSTTSESADVNDYVDSCSLYDGVTRVAGPEAPATNGQTIRFSTMSWTIAAGAVKNMTVQCNFANTSTTGDAFFAFDIALAGTNITAEDSSSNSVTATGNAVNGGTAPTRTVTVSDSGTLSVTVGSSTPSADFALTGTNNVEVAQYRFAATLESFNVQTLSFTEEQAEDDMLGTASTADSSVYANNISLVTLSYPKADGTTGTATASMSGNAATFSGLLMYVPVGTPKDVKVYVNLPPTDRDSGGSATSNEKIRMAFSDGDNSGSESFKATGAGSGFTLDEAASGIADLGDDVFATDSVPTFVVKETKPVVTLSSSSPSGSAVPGRSEVLRFSVAASSNEDVVLNKLLFKVTLTDNDTSNTDATSVDWNECDTDNPAVATTTADFDLYNLTMDGTSQTLDTADADWTLYQSTGAACDTTNFTQDLSFVGIALPVAEVVAKGTSNNFAVYFDSTGASSANDDSIRFDLPTDPIVSTYLNVADASNVTDLLETANTLAVDDGTAFKVGDVINYSTADATTVASTDEKMLVTGIATHNLYVVRGYLGSRIYTSDATLTGTAYDLTDDIQRLPGTLLWQDDGTNSAASATNTGDYWGSYLVDSLTVSGGTLVF